MSGFRKSGHIFANSVYRVYLPIYWVHTWVTEKFGQKIGHSNCLLVILLNMACFIPAKFSKTLAWYVAFKPLGYNVYA